MSLLFWCAALVVAYTYVGYPVLIAVLAKLRPQPWKRAAIEPSVSIVMPVHNGAAILATKLEHLFALDPALIKQIIVVSDGSTDATANILRGASDHRLQAIVLPEQVGKSSALNQGLKHATGEIVLFLDLRPRLEDGALHELVSNFADPQVGCVAGELVVVCGDDHDATAGAMAGAYWKYEQALRNYEAVFDSPVGVYGGFYAARTKLLTQLPPGLILDDMLQPLSIIRQGYRSVVDRDAVVVDSWPAKTGDEFQRKVRTLAGNFQLISVAPWLLGFRNRVVFQLVSHKLMRLVVPYAFALMLLSAWMLSRHSTAWLAVALVQTVGWLVAAASLYMRIPVVQRIASAVGAMLVLNFAAVAALHRFLFTSGPLWRIWSPTSVPGAGNAVWEREA